MTWAMEHIYIWVVWTIPKNTDVNMKEHRRKYAADPLETLLFDPQGACRPATILHPIRS